VPRGDPDPDCAVPPTPRRADVEKATSLHPARRRPVGFPDLAGFLLRRAAQRKGNSKAMPEISADGDGCIRRRCVECGKHFASSIEQRDTYWCPYCGVQRSWECWFTPVQKKYLDDALAEDVLATAYQELEDVLTDLALDSEGVIESQPRRSQPPRAPLHELTVDLATVPVPCHPGARLKLEPGWSRTRWCHLCGTPAPSGRAIVGRLRLRLPES